MMTPHDDALVQAGDSVVPTVIFRSHDGHEQNVEARIDQSLMRAARDADVPNIMADCGGACSCATCHVFVDADWFDAVGPIGEDEEAMLELAVGRQRNSRLSCQVNVTAAMDGLRVAVPESQY